MDTANIVLLLWTALAFYGFGQIWLAQIVIYPLFAVVGEQDYVRYHHFYSSHIPLPVILPGFATFLLPLALPFFGPHAVPMWLYWANIAAGMVGLAVTVFLEIPRHAKLERHGKDLRMIGELIRYNWPRTASITVQAILTVFMLTYIITPAS
jgi:hypothetical protein